MALFKRDSLRKEAKVSIVDQVLKDYASITSFEVLLKQKDNISAERDYMDEKVKELSAAIAWANVELTIANGWVRKENYLYSKKIKESAEANLAILQESFNVIDNTYKELNNLSQQILNMKKMEESVKVVEGFNKLSQGFSPSLAYAPLQELEKAVKRASHSMDAYLELKTN